MRKEKKDLNEKSQGRISGQNEAMKGDGRRGRKMIEKNRKKLEEKGQKKAKKNISEQDREELKEGRREKSEADRGENFEKA